MEDRVRKSMYKYVVSAQKPTAVIEVHTGNFTGKDERNLILCKSTRIEFHLLSKDGLIGQFDLGIYGRVATCKLYRPKGELTDLLFVLTEKYQFFVLGFDPERQEVVTKATGNVCDRTGRPNENGQFGIVDPDCKMIGLQLFLGLFKIVPMDRSGNLKEAFNVRLEEINVIDMQFLHGCQKPTICMLYEDNKECRHIKTYEVILKNKDLVDGPWNQPNVDPDTNMLVPVPMPFGGVLILGMESVSYHSGRSGQSSSGQPNTLSIPVRFGLIKAFCKVDDMGARWLLCDEWGGLHVIVLQSVTNPTNGDPSVQLNVAPLSNSPLNPSSSSSSSNPVSPNQLIMSVRNSVVRDLSMEYLGETSIASSIAYLDNGYVFIGSCYGDSQLIKLSAEKNPETDSYVEIIESYTNLGPILDFCVVDLERQGQGQVVTCSGGFKDGTLRVIRNGIGIDEQAAVELSGIKGMWSLRKSHETKWDTYIVQSFTGETRILALEDEELGEFEISGFNSESETLYSCNLRGDLLLQVTQLDARIVKCGSFELKSVWTPPQGHSITVASGNDNQVLVALGGGHLVLLGLNDQHELKEIRSNKLEYEISCISMSSDMTSSMTMRLKEESDTDMQMQVDEGFGDSHSSWNELAAIGMWTDNSIRILNLSSLEEIHKEPLGGETIPRSILFAAFENIPYLLVGLGDGLLYTFSINLHKLKSDCLKNVATGSGRMDNNDTKMDTSEGDFESWLLDRKKISLGTQPITLSSFRAKDSLNNVFAASDRPTVIYSNSKKLLFSNVNLREVTVMTPFNSESFPNCLALASEEDLTIGTINEIQKLHIRTVPLHEQPRRICHQQSTRTFGLCSTRAGPSNLPYSDHGESLPEAPLGLGSTTTSASHSFQPNTDDYLRMMEHNYVRLIDDQTFEILDSFELDEFETCFSIVSCHLSNGDGSGSGSITTNMTKALTDTQGVGSSSKPSNSVSEEYMVVGTTYAIDGEQEPMKGRILVFSVAEADGGTGKERKLVLRAERQTRGAVYCLSPFNGKLLAGINSKVQLFSFVSKGSGSFELQSECGHHGHIMVLYMQSRGDFIIIGDLMKSISLLMYKSLDGTIEEVSRDYNANWMTAVEMCNDEIYVGAENRFNLFTVKKNSEATTDEARHMLNVIGEFHLGEFVNAFRHGSLVMKTDSGSTSSSKNDVIASFHQVHGNMLYATVNGVLGVMADLDKDQYTMLLGIQKALNKVIKGVGGLSHSEWRAFHNSRKSNPAKGFIDGDLIEMFLDLKREDMEKIVEHYNKDVSSSKPSPGSSETVVNTLTVDNLVKIVEELSRIK